MYAFGAQFAEVRVDADLGQVRVSRMVGAFAAGRILNAKTARSQLMGGMVWGIGMALTEATMLDPVRGRYRERQSSGIPRAGQSGHATYRGDHSGRGRSARESDRRKRDRRDWNHWRYRRHRKCHLSRDRKTNSGATSNSG